MRGVRVVEGADLERLCGVTHRGFESLPLSHTIIENTHTTHHLFIFQLYDNLTHN